MSGALARRAATLHTRWAQLALVLLAVLAYGSALAGEYVFDDVHSVMGNPALAEPRDWWRLCWDPSAFSSGSSHMFRPVLLLSFAANMVLSPAAFALKAGNVLLHAGVVVLAFGWLRRLALSRQAAFAAAALFAVHPLLSESVNLVSARSELLLVFGLLVGLRAHLAWWHGKAQGAARFVPFFGILVGGLLACGSKETGVVLPGLLLVQTWVLRRPNGALGGGVGHWGRAVRSVLPVLCLVIGYLVLRKLLLGQATVSLLGRTGEDPGSGHGRTLLCQLATMGLLLPRVLLQMVVPVGLSMDPAVTFQKSFADPLVLAGWGSVAALTAVAVWPGRGARVRRLGCALAWATALPWVVVPLNMPLAEHRLYGPVLGVLMVLAAALPRRWTATLPATAPSAGWGRPVFAGVLVLFAVRSGWRSLDYRDERILWAQEIAARPYAWRAHWGFGMASLRAGDVVSAIEPIAQAHALYPEHFDVLRNYAEALLQLPAAHAQPFRALRVAEALNARSPGDPWARTLLADANTLVGRHTGEARWFVAAEQAALSCLQIATPKALVYRMAAAARRGLGDREGALAHLDTSLARGLDHVAVRLERAELLRELGRPAEARREVLRAQQQAPFDPAVQHALQQFAAPGR